MRTSAMVLTLLVAVFAGPARSETTVDVACLGNHVETCFVVIDGPIETGLTEKIKREHPNGFEAQTLFLNSPGGDLGEAIRLGRYVRNKTGLVTAIGAKRPPRFNADGTPANFGGGFPEGGRCESACAYVFMGGSERFLGPGDKLGLHRFRAALGQLDGSSAQRISSQLVSYMVEMGIDARVFRLASEKGASDMHYVSREEALAYDLITPVGYDAFYMEPYKGGVIASSRRLDPTGPYDTANQVTFFCRGQNAFALIRAEGGWLDTAPEAPLVSVGIDGEEDRTTTQVVVRSMDDSDYVTITLSDHARAALTTAQSAYLSAGYSRVAGAARRVKLTLSDMDRAMITSAFTHCIG